MCIRDRSEDELKTREDVGKKESQAENDVENTVLNIETQTALAVERDILASELDSTLKLENGLWIGAHIVCLPFFYDEYTIRARIKPSQQSQYNQAIITTCGRFSAMGKRGITLVSPLTNYIRNYQDFSSSDRAQLETDLIERVFQWLKGETSLESQAPTTTSHSLQVIMADVEHAEYVFEQEETRDRYMLGEVRLATIQAIRHSDFLPPQVKYKLLEDLKTLSRDKIFDIGTFLLWEIRKSSAHHEKLLYYMLRIFKRFSDGVVERVR